MSYDTVKSFKVDFERLEITGKISPSNVRDWRDRRIVEPFKITFGNQEELEAKLVGIANGYLEGSTKFPPSTTFAKRVDWLVENGYAYDTNGNKNSMWKWYTLPDTKEVREVLTGKKKIKTPYYIVIVKSDKSINGYNLILKLIERKFSTKAKLTIIGNYKEELTTQQIIERSKGTRRLSKLRKSQLDYLKENYKDWLENNNAEIIEVS